MLEVIAKMAKASGLKRSEVRKIWEQAKLSTAPKGKKVKKGTAKHIQDAFAKFNKTMSELGEQHAAAKAALSQPESETHKEFQLHDEDDE